MKNDLKHGEILFAEGKADEAEKIFLELLTDNPTNPEVLNNLGVIYHTRRDFEKAEDNFLKAYEAQGDNLDALLNLAGLYQETKRWEDASVQLEKCITLNPIEPNLHLQLGRVYLEMGNSEKARSALTRSLELVPDQDDAREILEILENKKKPSSYFTPTGRRQPTVCVGLPVYNGGEMLSEAIESILAQDFEDIELVISDNCSTDNTMETCLKYQKMDKRIRYYRFNENLFGKNFPTVLAHCNSPYFKWAADDDLLQRSFISKCLEKIEQDPSIALVYPRTQMMDSNSNIMGIANDHLNTDQDDPIERFKHLIWELGMCHVFYGLYRTNIIRRVPIWGDVFLGADNLALAEIAIFGKIVQINDILFIRRLTRNYNHNTLAEYYVDLMKSNPKRLLDGITLYHCRLTCANIELLKYLEIEDSERNSLINYVIKCFKAKYGVKMQYEIDRAVRLINDGYLYYTWDGRRSRTWHSDDLTTTDYFHINNLINDLGEGLLVYPERTDLRDVYEMCINKASNFNAVSS